MPYCGVLFKRDRFIQDFKVSPPILPPTLVWVASIVVKRELLTLMFLLDLYFSMALLSPSATKLSHCVYNDHAALNDLLNLQLCELLG